MADPALLDKIRDYLVKERRLRKPPSDNDRLVTGGIIDSFALVDLQLWMQKEFDFWADDTDMIVDNLDSIAMIGDFIEQRR